MSRFSSSIGFGRDVEVSLPGIPWVPSGYNTWFKPARISVQSGTWANLVKIPAGQKVGLHRHVGPVQGYTLQGHWRYLERDWVAGPGSYIFEGDGSTHTLVVEPGDEMITFFVSGKLQYLDEEGTVTREDSAESKLRLYLDFCLENDLEPRDFVYELET